MRCAAHSQGIQVEQCQLGPAQVECAGVQLPAEHGNHLKIDQLGRDQPFAAQPRPGTVTVAAVVGQRHGDHASVNDEHAHAATS
jgi:hypothetical protein